MTLTFPDLPGQPDAHGRRRRQLGQPAPLTPWVHAEPDPCLDPAGHRPGYQMLYRFANARHRCAGGRRPQRGQRRRSRTARSPGRSSWLSVKLDAERNTAPFVPFVVAFGVLGLVMSVLIIGNVVSGAVGAATRRIGILKALGFTPAQVVRAYVAQALIPASGRHVLGVVLGNVFAKPLLSRAEFAYGTVSLSVATWVDIAAPVARSCSSR